ncbi:MAG: hypothetical protein WC722_05785 [Rhodospirillales bacterium]|jgi:hypothetical protein
MPGDEKSIQGHIWLREINGRVDLCGQVGGKTVVEAPQSEMLLLNLIEEAAKALRALRHARPS